jgi:hypothetical protein
MKCSSNSTYTCVFPDPVSICDTSSIRNVPRLCQKPPYGNNYVPSQALFKHFELVFPDLCKESSFSDTSKDADFLSIVLAGSIELAISLIRIMCSHVSLLIFGFSIEDKLVFENSTALNCGRPSLDFRVLIPQLLPRRKCKDN